MSGSVWVGIQGVGGFVDMMIRDRGRMAGWVDLRAICVWSRIWTGLVGWVEWRHSPRYINTLSFLKGREVRSERDLAMSTLRGLAGSRSHVVMDFILSSLLEILV